MKLLFTKMHGLGNDFVVLNAIIQPFTLDSAAIRSLADRHLGIGFDQLLIVEAAQSDDADFRYRIFNADGDEVEQCGNGARCFARFVIDKGLTEKTCIRVETNSGLIILNIEKNGFVTVDMGAPIFQLENIPAKFSSQADSYLIQINGEEHRIGVVSMGNPHAVLFVDDIQTAAVKELGSLIENDPHFPNRVNVGFVQIHSPQKISLRVYERGVGETLACGTGACAAMVIGRLWGKLEENVQVQLQGGTLNIQWQGNNSSVNMTGPAETIFEGSIEI